MRSLVVSILVASVAILGCRAPCKNNLPPAEMLMHPGPGVDGPGPGVMMYQPGVPCAGHDLADGICGPGRDDRDLGRRRARRVRFAAAGLPRPLQLPARRDLPA